VTPNAALEQIAGLLSGLPDESFEGMLVFFDSLVATSDPAGRSAAADVLRKAAAGCSDTARRDRLLQAAAGVEEGQSAGSAAAVPEGTFGVTQEEFDARQAASPPIPTPVDDDDGEETPYMEAEPPAVPHLPVRHFFPGLVVRIGRDFQDAMFSCFCSGNVYDIEDCSSTSGAWTLLCTDCRIRLTDAGQPEIIENAGNAWFQPVPTVACLLAVLEAIDNGLRDFEEEASDDVIASIDPLREDIGNCERWLTRTRGEGRAPQYRKAAVAERIFGADHELAAWIRWLFGAITVCVSDQALNS
jgi:hypothetical protein